MTDAPVTQAHLDWAERALAEEPALPELIVITWVFIERKLAVKRTAQALANMEEYARRASERERRALEEELEAAKRQVRIAEHRAWGEGAAFFSEEEYGRPSAPGDFDDKNPYPKVE